MKKHNNIPAQRIWSKAALYACVGILASAAASCTVRTTEPITVNPDAVVLTPDINNDISINSVINIPAGYVNSRSMATIEPELILGSQVVEKFEPITLTGKIYEKKADRLRALYNVRNEAQSKAVKVNDKADVAVPIRESIHLDDDFDSGRIVAYVTSNGCGQCYGTDTLVLAYLSNLSSLIDADNLLVQWIDTVPDDMGKYFDGEGQARLQFIVDKWDIVSDLANNAVEMDSMLSALRPVLTDSLNTLQTMSIFGSASAEGGYKHNVELAQKRANSAKEWLNDRLHLTPAQMRIIKIGSEPEGWGPVIASMHAAGNPDSALVKEIVRKYPDVKSFEAERRIRKLACWPEIADKHLAKDRKVIYKYKYQIRDFKTDQEKIEMFDKRPDAFSEVEFLKLAKIRENNTDSLIDIYETMVKYKPQSEIGVNNLAVLYYNNGMYDKAIDLLQKQKRPTPDMLTTLALCYSKVGDDEKAMKVLNGLGTEKAVYNLGVIQANNHQMAAAYNNLIGARDLNAAIAALGIGENQEALDILNGMSDSSNKIDYVKAIAYTRLGNTDQALKYLKRACQDEGLRNRAINEADFIPLQKEWKYKQIFQ